MYQYYENETFSPHHSVGVVINDVMLPFISHDLSLTTDVYIKYLEELVLPWCWKTLRPATGFCAMTEKISVISSPLNICPLTPPTPDCNLLDCYKWGVFEWGPKRTQCNTKDKLKARIAMAFTHLNTVTIKNTCRRFQNYLEAMVMWDVYVIFIFV